MQQSTTEFPCDFYIKVMGKNTPEFETTVLEIVSRHVPNLTEGAIQLRPSKENRYLSITIKISAESPSQVEAIYRDLKACPLVLMAL